MNNYEAIKNMSMKEMEEVLLKTVCSGECYSNCELGILPYNKNKSCVRMWLESDANFTIDEIIDK